MVAGSHWRCLRIRRPAGAGNSSSRLLRPASPAAPTRNRAVRVRAGRGHGVAAGAHRWGWHHQGSAVSAPQIRLSAATSSMTRHRSGTGGLGRSTTCGASCAAPVRTAARQHLMGRRAWTIPGHAAAAKPLWVGACSGAVHGSGGAKLRAAAARAGSEGGGVITWGVDATRATTRCGLCADGFHAAVGDYSCAPCPRSDMAAGCTCAAGSATVGTAASPVCLGPQAGCSSPRTTVWNVGLGPSAAVCPRQ